MSYCLVSGKKLANKWRAMRDNYVRYLKQLKWNKNKKYKYAKRLSTFLIVKNNDADNDADDDSSDEAAQTSKTRRRTSSYDDDYLDTKRTRVSASPLFVNKEEPLSSDENELEIATPQPPTPEAVFPELTSTDSIDEDRCFFDSLMPACKTLDLDQKLHFRSQVINLLRHIRKGNDRIILDPVNGVFVNED